MQTEPAHHEAGIKAVSVSGDALVQLIAHRPPMVMIDRLISVGKEFSETLYRVPDDGVFSVEKQLSEAGLIENMAQTIAAGSGYRRQKEGKEIFKGFLSMLKNLKIERLPDCGSEIRTEVRYENRAMDFRIFSGRVFSDTDQIAECEIRIYTPGNQEDSV